MLLTSKSYVDNDVHKVTPQQKLANGLHTVYARKTFLLSLTRVYQQTAQVNVHPLVFNHEKLRFYLKAIRR